MMSKRQQTARQSHSKFSRLTFRATGQTPGHRTKFKYDGNGNLTNWVCGSTNWVYEWDWADRMTKVTSNGVVVLENWYDAGSHRIGKAEVSGAASARHVYLYDGWDIVGISSEGSGLYETFTRGVALAGDIGGLIAVTRNNQRYYLHNNHRGDVIAMRDGTTTAGTCTYSAFGSLLGSTGTDVCRFKFSSKERDPSTGLLYYGYRFFAPQWQRWMSADPIIRPPSSAAPLGIAELLMEEESNVYRFTANSPEDDYDEWGLMAHRKKRPSCYDKHTKAHGRPIGGAKPGKKKPNFRRAPGKGGCGCGPGAAGLALWFTLDAACQEIPDHVFPDCDGECPKGTIATERKFLFFTWIECVPWT